MGFLLSSTNVEPARSAYFGRYLLPLIWNEMDKNNKKYMHLTITKHLIDIITLQDGPTSTMWRKSGLKKHFFHDREYQ